MPIRVIHLLEFIHIKENKHHTYNDLGRIA